MSPTYLSITFTFNGTKNDIHWIFTMLICNRTNKIHDNEGMNEIHSMLCRTHFFVQSDEADDQD